MHSYGGLVEPKGSKLSLLKSTFNAEILYAGCLGLSLVILAQFTLEMCVAGSNHKKITKNPYWGGVQGRLRSLMLVSPERSSAVLVMIHNKSVSICNHSHSRARLVSSSRNRTFSRGYPNLMRSYKGLLQPRGSKLALLKSTFQAENFIRRLYWSICSDLDAVHS